MNGKSDHPRPAEAAERLVKAGRLGEAVTEYEKILDGTAQDIPIRNIIGDLCVQLGREERAVRVFRANVEALEAHGSYPQALALAKRIYKLAPADASIIVKLGDLYSRLGFLGEAKGEYARALDRLGDDDAKDRIALAEKLARLDRSDVEARLRLAGFLAAAGLFDRAAAELNETADVYLARGDAAEAERVLREALRIKDGEARTLANLARVLKRGQRMEEAVKLIEESIRRHGPQPGLVALLGDLYLEGRMDAKAKDVFQRLLEEDPDRADARAKMGIIELRSGRPDAAFTLYEPLVASLLNRAKEDRAAGLLGLILLSHPSHLPSLDKLASVFRRGGRIEHLEAVLRLLNEEARRQGREDIRRRTVRELLDLRPEDGALKKEWKTIKDVGGQEAGEDLPERAAAWPAKDREIILTNLTKADLFVEQGLIRNAHRILENLRLLYPDDPRIKDKLSALPAEPPPPGAEDLAALVSRLAAEDERRSRTGAPPPALSLPEKIVSDTVSLEEIFGGTDLAANPVSPASRIVYPDLTAKIREELEAIEAESFRQIKDRTAVIEKDLNEIVAEFQRQVERKLDRADYETRYNLGLAFLEQGLLDEAVAEFKLAAEDPTRTIDCYALIAQAFRRRKNHWEALRWIDEALRRAGQGTDADFALTFDRAEILEDLNENVDALRHFRRVQTWNGTYRDVAKRVRILERITG
ncbi:MAG: tetratricopeptide repeat protein [Candidatus Aminicenantes bacterium]|nr:tetratricopeptide repeat protein [Candidatus Aminicenantes bacterium]